MADTVNDQAFDVLFRDARSQNMWRDEPVASDKLRALYDVMKWGPTSANCFPMRTVFVVSQDEKDRLATMVLEGNIEKVAKAAAVAIIGYDLEFYELIPQLFPHAPEAREWFSEDEEVALTTAFRNGTLQGAYLMMAARGLGLDCGPMSGFDNAAVDAAFFAGTRIKSNFLCALGSGDPEALFPRSPRPAFDDVCKIL